MSKFFKFIIAMFISFLPGAVGVLFTPRSNMDLWYNALNKSALTPDAWVFSVAWTVLYALLGWALYLVMVRQNKRQSKNLAYSLFAVQAALNALWSYVFFGMQLPLVALFVLVTLIEIAIWMARVFFPIDKWASILVWPYIVWMIFAMYLNGVIVFLN